MPTVSSQNRFFFHFLHFMILNILFNLKDKNPSNKKQFLILKKLSRKPKYVLALN